MLFLEQTQGFGGGPRDGSEAVPRPSLFELLMQERMALGFKPAIEYLLQAVCDTYPQVATLGPVRHMDESYALLRALVERYFLSRYDALASEKFYGMKRVMLRTTTTTHEPLTPDARGRSLFYAVVVPYLKAKLDTYHQTLKAQTPPTDTIDATADDDNDDAPRPKWRTFLRRLKQLKLLLALKRGFVSGYPFAHFAYEAAFFFHQWLYLFGDTPYFSPFLRRMGVILVRTTANDESRIMQQQTEYRDQVLKALSDARLSTRLRRGLVRASWAVYDHSYVLLVLGIACYKFMEWMYSEEGTAAKVRLTGTDAPVPPPPLPPSFSGNASVLLSTHDSNTCPLCQRPRVNPAASVSGYVFCYPCLYHHVEDHGECPVTGMKCDVKSIIKIYDDVTS